MNCFEIKLFRIAFCVFLCAPLNLLAEDSKISIIQKKQIVKKKIKNLTLKPNRIAQAVELKLIVSAEKSKVGTMEPVYLSIQIKSSNKVLVAWQDMRNKSSSFDMFNYIIFNRFGEEVLKTSLSKSRISRLGSAGTQVVHPASSWSFSYLVNKHYDMTYGSPFTIIVWRDIRFHPSRDPKKMFSKKMYRMVSEPITIHISDEYATPCFRKKKKPTIKNVPKLKSVKKKKK